MKVLIGSIFTTRLTALWHMPRRQYLAYVILRRLARLTGFILLAVGVISLTRSYLAEAAPTDDTTPNA